MNKLERQIRDHNSSMRCVSYVNNIHSDLFLQSSKGDLMITGGCKEKRRALLLNWLEHKRRTENSTVIIFSDDPEMKASVIERATDGIIGQLYVIDQQYNEYDFFHSMHRNLIGDYFAKASIERGAKDTSNLLEYTDNLLQIMEQVEEINLASLKTMLKKPDADIEIQGDSNGIEAALTNSSATQGGVMLRNLVNATGRAFAPLTSDDCKSGFNLISQIDQDCVILIDVPTEQIDLFAVYFAQELISVMNRRFSICFDDEAILNNSEMATVVKLLKQKEMVEVIASYDNILSVQLQNSESVLQNFNRYIVLLNGQMNAMDLQKVLSNFGQYTAMTSVQHREKMPALIFTPIGSHGDHAMSFVRDRVILQEEKGQEALISSGSDARLTITKHLLT